MKKTTCSNEANHTRFPALGYIEQEQWAEEMMKTHKQTQCPKCGLWAIWVQRIKAQNGPTRA